MATNAISGGSQPLPVGARGLGLGALNGTPAKKAVTGSQEDTKIKSAAQQFEALMIGELLKSARGDEGAGWLGSGEDNADSTMAEYGEQFVATMMAQQGGLGLSGLIAQGLRRPSSGASPSSRSHSAPAANP